LATTREKQTRCQPPKRAKTAHFNANVTPYDSLLFAHYDQKEPIHKPFYASCPKKAKKWSKKANLSIKKSVKKTHPMRENHALSLFIGLFTQKKREKHAILRIYH
jgi:hypothetical protein